MGSGAHRWKNLRRLTFSTVVIRPAIDSAGDIGRQLAEIDRVYAAYPHLNDDDFVARHRDEWLR